MTPEERAQLLQGLRAEQQRRAGAQSNPFVQASPNATLGPGALARPQARAATPQAQIPPTATRAPMSRVRAAGEGAVDAMTLGAGDEMAGRMAQSVVDPGGAIGFGTGLPVADSAARLAAAAFERMSPMARAIPLERRRELGERLRADVTDQRREDINQAFTDHPLSTMGGAIAPLLATTMMTGGGATPAHASRFAVSGAARAAPASGAAMRMVRGGATGAGVAGGYGWNSGTEGNRASSAVNQAVWGGGFGAVIPGLSAAAGRATRIQSPTARTLLGAGTTGGLVGGGTYAVTGDPEMAAAAGGAAAVGGGLAVNWPHLRVQPNAVGMGGGNVGMAAPPRRPDRMVKTMATLTSRAGLSADDVAERLDAAAAQPAGRVFADILGRPAERRARTLAELPGETLTLAERRMQERMAGQGQRIGNAISGQTERDAMEVLSERVRGASRDLLEPALRNAPPESRAAAAQALEALQARPTVQQAMAVARQGVQEDVAAGRLPREALDDPIQLLHDLKIVLQAQAQDPMTLGRDSLGRIDNMRLVATANDIGDVLRRSVPGYGDAMAELEQLITPREIMRVVDRAQRGDTVNVAGAALRNPEVRRAIDDRGFEDIGRMLREEHALYQAAGRMSPNTNSITMPLGLDVADQIAQEGFAPTRWASRALGAVTSPLREGARNRLGAALYEPVDSGLSGFNPERVEALRSYLRDEMIRRQRATSNATVNGALGGIGGGAITPEGY